MRGFRFCLIADVREEERERKDREGFILPKKKRPGFVHLFTENAEKELLRLAKRCPEGEFILFEATKMAQKIPGTDEFKIEEWID